jgi:hypothetical protein
VHGGPRLSKAVLPRAIGMERTLKKHRATFRQHPARYAHYVGAMGVAYLRSGRWWRAVVATTHSLTIDPRPFRSYVWWLAALCGPWPVALRRRLRARRRRQPGAEPVA